MKKPQKSFDDLHFDFPYKTMPICVKHDEFDTTKTCWFSCVEHMHKYLTRYGIDKYAARDINGNDVSISSGPPQKAPKKQKIAFSSIEDFFK